MGKIEIKNLIKNYGDIQAVSDFSYVFESNGKYAIIGQEGAGKSTLLNVISGLESYDCGSVMIDGSERNLLLPRDVKMTYIMSSPLFFESKSILFNMEYLCKVCSKSFTREELVCLIEEHNFDPKEKVKKLTYLEKLMLSILRAKIKNSDFVIVDLDKNLENIDFKSGAFQELVLWLKNYPGMVIVVENGVNFASNFTQEILFLNFGVLKGKISLQNELLNPTSFFTYKCALQKYGKLEKEKNVEVEKLMCGMAITSSNLSPSEQKELEKILMKKNNFNVGDKLEILKIGEYFFEKIGGKILN